MFSFSTTTDAKPSTRSDPGALEGVADSTAAVADEVGVVPGPEPSLGETDGVPLSCTGAAQPAMSKAAARTPRLRREVARG